MAEEYETGRVIMQLVCSRCRANLGKEHCCYCTKALSNGEIVVCDGVVHTHKSCVDKEEK